MRPATLAFRGVLETRAATRDRGATGWRSRFRIPTHRVDSLKERLVRPFAARDYRELRALDGISFEIRQGEFFGIVGRNGSGKSTLLKLLASIYRADAGTIRMAGRLAPFIELGVGFNLELTARENVVLNGVMMGLTPAGDAPPARRDDRLRRTAGLRRPETEELLLGDAGPARLLADDAGRRRHPADRRGARGRRRRLPAEVRRRLPRDESRGEDDRPRHPRDVDGRGVLPPRDADRRRQDPARSATRPRWARRYLRLNFEQAASAVDGPRRTASDARCGCSTPGSRTPSGSARPTSSTASRSSCGSSSKRATDCRRARRRVHRGQRRRRRRLPVRRRGRWRRRSPRDRGRRAGQGRADDREPARRRAATSSTAVSTACRRPASLCYVHNAIDFVVFGGAADRTASSPPARDDDAS